MSFTTPFNSLQHFAAKRHAGTAATNIIPPEMFKDAVDEITTWDDYATTPLYALSNLATSLGVAEILYKDEGPRFGLGSFKALGGSYAASRLILQEVSRITGKSLTPADIRSGQYTAEIAAITLVSATDGNHGRSLAWGAQNLGAPCKIYIHAEVSEGRAQSMRDLGADVIRIAGDYDDSVRLAQKDAAENGWFIVSDTTWEGYVTPPRNVMAGYGVMTHEICELLDQAPTHVFLQGGVGGLAASIAAGLRQYWGDASPRVIVVEPDLADCLYQSARNDAATTVKICEESVMAGLSCGKPSPLAWDILRQEAADFITIPDSVIAPTMRLLGNPLGDDPEIIAGESAVASLAALITATNLPSIRQALNLDQNARILIIGTEGATDLEIYNRMMAQ